MSSTKGGKQPLISQYVRRPLGTCRSSIVVNSNGVNIKMKTGSTVATKVNKPVVSTVVQNESIDISTLCKVVKVPGLKKTSTLGTYSQDIQPPVPVLGKNQITGPSGANNIEQVTDVDSHDTCFPLLVSEYVQDIYRHLWHLETQNKIPNGFLAGQKVSPWMRATIIDWLIQLQVGFTLLPETLYLTVAIVDRYLASESEIPCEQLQLLAVTAMFIASKYEEMQAPELSAFAYITDYAFTIKDIIQMELKVLNTLNGYISFPLPLQFLRRNSKVGEVGQASHTLAKYLMELCLTEYSVSHVRPSLQAAAALCLSLKLLGGQKWTSNLAYYSGYTETEILPTMCLMAEVLRRSSSSKYQAARTKYSSEAQMRISLIPHLKSKFVTKLASKVKI